MVQQSSDTGSLNCHGRKMSLFYYSQVTHDEVSQRRKHRENVVQDCFAWRDHLHSRIERIEIRS